MNLSVASQPDEDQIYIYFGSEMECVVCIAKQTSLDEFLTDYPDIYFKTVWVSYFDEDNVTAFRAWKEEYGISNEPTPFALMGKGNNTILLHSNEITYNKLEETYNFLINYDPANPDDDTDDDSNKDPITPFLALGSGFLTGLSPCVILVTTFLSSVLVIQDTKKNDKNGMQTINKNFDSINMKKSENEININEENILINTEPNKKKVEESTQNLQSAIINKISLLPIFLGFILGVVLMYVSISVASLWLFSSFSNFILGDDIRYIIVTILVLLGFWFIVDAFNENSKLFKTPKGVKRLIGKWARKGKFLYSLILGYFFSIIKIPCVASGLFALILGISDNPSLYVPSVLLFIAGSMTPLIILMILIGFGIKLDKVENFRIKYRPYIRIASGLMIIGLSLWALFS